MKIGVLECDHLPAEIRERHGDFTQMFASLLQDSGFNFIGHRVSNMAFPASVLEADGWIITGSRDAVYDDHAYIAPLEMFIRGAYEAQVPMVGICFGHQIIAKALGGEVQKFEGGAALGHNDYDVDGHGRLTLNAWHQDQVITPPRSAETIASNTFCAHAGLRYGDHALSYQPHPEFSNTAMAEFTRLEDVIAHTPPEALQSVRDSVNTPTQDANIAKDIIRFFRLPRP